MVNISEAKDENTPAKRYSEMPLCKGGKGRIMKKK